MKNLSEHIHESFANNTHLVNTQPLKTIYHRSNPMFRKLIDKQGLQPKGKSEAWLSDTNINGNVIFATNSANVDDLFDSGYDDDIYKIDTTKLSNTWYKDPNFVNTNNKHMITFDPIPRSAITLVYKGSGESYS